MKLIKTAQRPSYTAVVSPESVSQNSVAPWQTILSNFQIPQGWKTHAHHMTMYMGGCQHENLLGQNVNLTVVGIGKDENAMALLVQTPTPCKNEKPHITIATAPGAKPYLSNKIQQWESIEPFTLSGTVREVSNQGQLFPLPEQEVQEVQEEPGMEKTL